MSDKPSTPKGSQTDNPSAARAVNQGRINTQQKDGGQLRHDEARTDQSEGRKGGGQPTAMHGQGAGFSRKPTHE